MHAFTLGDEVRTVIPEPTSAALLKQGLVGIAARRRRYGDVRLAAWIGLVAALLAGAPPCQAGLLPFTGTVSICARFSGGSCPSPGSSSFKLEWQVTGVAQLDDTLLTFAQPADLQSETFAGRGRFIGGITLVHMAATGGQLNAGTVDLATQGVQGMGVMLDSLRMMGTYSHRTTFPTLSGSTFVDAIKTTIVDVLFAHGTLGTGAEIVGQRTTYTQTTISPVPGGFRHRPATATAAPWSVLTAAVQGGGGVLQLVTPLRVRLSGIPGDPATVFENNNTVLSVSLVFVPEPATGLLCGLGTLVFGYLGRRRRLALH